MTIEIKKSKKPVKYKLAITILEERLEQVKLNKNKELINNLTQTISKELKRPNGGNKKLIDTLQKILDKAS